MTHVSRRFAIGLAAGALAVPGWSLAQGAPAWAPRALTAAQARALDAYLDTLIPATSSPGAKDAGVGSFIDRALADWSLPAQAAAVRQGLDRIDADAKATHGKAFADLDGGARRAVIAAWEKDPKGAAAYVSLKDLAVTGYFTSEPGATVALRYDPIPGAYRGCIPLSEIGRAWAT